jgi:predicted PurR-regulated permease PerM
VSKVRGSIDRDRIIVFSLDDRTGNVLTTAALFTAAAAIVYLARGAFFVLLMSLLFAYLLDPAVSFVQRHSRLGRNNRVWAIAQVYLTGTLVLGGLGYEFGQRLAAQARNLNGSFRNILETFPSGKAATGPGSVLGLSAAQQLRIHDFLAGHRDSITRLLDLAAESTAHFAANAAWLFAIPVLAIFLLRDGCEIAGAMVAAGESRGDQTLARRTLERIDTMLAKYIRAQLALAGLSFLFYSVSLLLMRFPYAIALGFLGGILEFLPVVGWIASAAAILTVGLLTHSHWIWMAALIVVWRLVQDYLNSPRIMGDSLELQPLTVVFALMVGAQVGGIAGVYLSVPTVAVLRIVWLECFSARNFTAALPVHPIQPSSH